jgi:hypothetical protein
VWGSLTDIISVRLLRSHVPWGPVLNQGDWFVRTAYSAVTQNTEHRTQPRESPKLLHLRSYPCVLCKHYPYTTLQPDYSTAPSVDTDTDTDTGVGSTFFTLYTLQQHGAVQLQQLHNSVPYPKHAIQYSGFHLDPELASRDEGAPREGRTRGHKPFSEF